MSNLDLAIEVVIEEAVTTANASTTDVAHLVPNVDMNTDVRIVTNLVMIFIIVAS